MNQYYKEENNELKSNPEIIEYKYKGIVYKFKTDIGVFSKGKIDKGSIELLKYIEKNINLKGDVLEVGLGYGFISILLEKIYKEIIIEAVEINNRALELAKENIKINESKRLIPIKSNLYKECKKKYDFIISNPPFHAGKKIINEMIEEGKEYLKFKGKLIYVVRKNYGMNSIVKNLENFFNILEKKKVASDYYIIVAEKK